MISPVKIWRRQKEIRKLLGSKGKILAWTKVFVAGPDFKNQAPYPVILVKFENGKRAVGQLVDYQDKDLRTGEEVIAILRRVREANKEEVIPYGIKFKPLK